MQIIDQILNRNIKFNIMMRSLIIFVLFISILPLDKPDVSAQEPDKSQVIYLPLINKNSTVSCPEGPDQWLCLLNQYRAFAGINPVKVNDYFNYGLSLHTTYMLYNPTQSNIHTEYEEKPGYSNDGKIAASQSNMLKLLGATYLTTKQSIDLWMATPSHRYKMLHPDLAESGFYLKCDTDNCFSGLNILGSLPPSYLVNINEVIYPGDKQPGIPSTRYPITWGFYIPWTGNETDSDEVRLVSAAIYDDKNQKISFTSSEPNHSDGVWDYNNQVILTPSTDLLPNNTYRVEMTVSFRGSNYSRSWSFTTGQ